MSLVNTGVSMKVSFIRKGYAIDVLSLRSGGRRLDRVPAASDYGLGRLEAGTIWVNTYRSTDYTMPFGGYKVRRLGRSGAWERRTGSRRSRLDYLQTKSVWYHARGDVANPHVRR